MTRRDGRARNDSVGFLYPNGFKRKPTDPDVTGSVTVDDCKRDLKGWWNEKNGSRYLTVRMAAPPREIVPTPAEAAVAAGERWPCPVCPAPSAESCALCSGARTFDPQIVIVARQRRASRQCTLDDAADELGVAPQRLSELEMGRSLAPNAFGGPERRRTVGLLLIRYLQMLGLLERSR